MFLIMMFWILAPLRISLHPAIIRIDQSYTVCVEGLKPGEALDVRYKRPHYSNVWTAELWQNAECQTQSYNSGWNRDLGRWQITGIRIHSVPDGAWQPVSAVVTILPDDKLLRVLKQQIDSDMEQLRQESALWHKAFLAAIAGVAYLAACAMAALVIGRFYGQGRPEGV
jgi:hypothetical protein